MHVVFAYRALTVFGAPFQGTSTGFVSSLMWVLQPRRRKAVGLGSAPFARRY